MRSMIAASGLCTLGFLAAAPAADGIAAQQAAPRMVLSIGQNAELEFGRLRGLALADDGRLFALDVMNSRVLRFAANGDYEGAFGRKGSGPGELSDRAVGIVWVRGNVVVIDSRNRRTTAFGADGAFLHSRPLSLEEGTPVGWSAAGDRVAYVVRAHTSDTRVGAPVRHLVMSFDPLGVAQADTIALFDLPAEDQATVSTTVDMLLDLRTPRLLTAGGGSRGILVARSNSRDITIAQVAGRRSVTIVDLRRSPYTRRQIAAIVDRADSAQQEAYRAGLAAAGPLPGPAPRLNLQIIPPRVRPEITSLLADDHVFLVGRGDHVPDTAMIPWEEYDYSGRLMRRFVLPSSFQPLVVLGGRVYGLVKDEFDLERIVAYEIQ
jgi:hypothetical protein